MMWWSHYRTKITDLYYSTSRQIVFRDPGPLNMFTGDHQASLEMNTIISPGIRFTRNITSMIHQTLDKDMKNEHLFRQS